MIMTTAQVVETPVTVNNNSLIQDYVDPDDHTQPTYKMTPGFKPFTKKQRIVHRQSLVACENIRFSSKSEEKRMFSQARPRELPI